MLSFSLQEMVLFIMWDLALIGTLSVGASFGAAGTWIYFRRKIRSYHQLAEEIIGKAEQEADMITQEAELSSKKGELENQQKLHEMKMEERRRVDKEDARLKQREDKLEARMQLVEKKLSSIEKKEIILQQRKEQSDKERQALAADRKRVVEDLEKLSSFTQKEARDELLKQVEQEIKLECSNLIKRLKSEAEEDAEQEAKRILTTMIHRLAVPCVSEVAISAVPLPSEDLKGRVIGREGRNIRALEQATGVNFVIDDTPNAVVLSSYDPVRREVARQVLLELIQDGRIHPSRIEELVKKHERQLQKQIRNLGEDAAVQIGAGDIHPEILKLLGKLHFRYSYGQNVLTHSLEVAHIMGLLAAELGLDVSIAKRIGLLHDVGKAVSHEVEGSHALVGADLARKYGEHATVVNGIACHHNEVMALSVVGSLCGTADAISASRPGARVEAVEHYVRRLKKLEQIAKRRSCVEKAYALQAGREVRVTVLPDELTDQGTFELARDLAKEIERELVYPGKIKVTVIREQQATEYAL